MQSNQVFVAAIASVLFAGVWQSEVRGQESLRRGARSSPGRIVAQKQIQRPEESSKARIVPGLKLQRETRSSVRIVPPREAPIKTTTKTEASSGSMQTKLEGRAVATGDGQRLGQSLVAGSQAAKKGGSVGKHSTIGNQNKGSQGSEQSKVAEKDRREASLRGHERAVERLDDAAKVAQRHAAREMFQKESIAAAQRQGGKEHRDELRAKFEEGRSQLAERKDLTRGNKDSQEGALQNLDDATKAALRQSAREQRQKESAAGGARVEGKEHREAKQQATINDGKARSAEQRKAHDREAAQVSSAAKEGQASRSHAGGGGGSKGHLERQSAASSVKGSGTGIAKENGNWGRTRVLSGRPGGNVRPRDWSREDRLRHGTGKIHVGTERDGAWPPPAGTAGLAASGLRMQLKWYQNPDSPAFAFVQENVFDQMDPDDTGLREIAEFATWSLLTGAGFGEFLADAAGGFIAGNERQRGEAVSELHQAFTLGMSSSGNQPTEVGKLIQDLTGIGADSASRNRRDSDSNDGTTSGGGGGASPGTPGQGRSYDPHEDNFDYGISGGEDDGDGSQPVDPGDGQQDEGDDNDSSDNSADGNVSDGDPEVHYYDSMEDYRNSPEYNSDLDNGDDGETDLAEDPSTGHGGKTGSDLGAAGRVRHGARDGRSGMQQLRDLVTGRTSSPLTKGTGADDSEEPVLDTSSSDAGPAGRTDDLREMPGHRSFGSGGPIGIVSFLEPVWWLINGPRAQPRN